MGAIKVNVRLFGTLRKDTPHYDPNRGVEVVMNEGDMLLDLVRSLGLPEDEFRIFMVKGSVRTLTYRLNGFDEISIFLPAAGG